MLVTLNRIVFYRDTHLYFVEPTHPYLTPLRAFCTTAQIESDAIIAGLLDAESILSTGQVTSW